MVHRDDFIDRIIAPNCWFWFQRLREVVGPMIGSSERLRLIGHCCPISYPLTEDLDLSCRKRFTILGHPFDVGRRTFDRLYQEALGWSVGNHRLPSIAPKRNSTREIEPQATFGEEGPMAKNTLALQNRLDVFCVIDGQQVIVEP